MCAGSILRDIGSVSSRSSQASTSRSWTGRHRRDFGFARRARRQRARVRSVCIPVQRSLPCDRHYAPRFRALQPGGACYDIDTRARDDIAVLDKLKIREAIFVGHSISGTELDKLGAAYPDRVKKLVYLDGLDLGS